MSTERLRRVAELARQMADGQQPTRKDFVVQVLRHAIATGVLQDGDELNQLQLAELLGVSRIPIREAIRQLESEGLVESRAFRRAVVKRITPERFREYYEIRIQLERLAVRYAARHLQPHELDQLEALVEEMERVDDHRRWLELNRKFHDLLCQASRMPVLCEFIARLRDTVQRHLLRAYQVNRCASANREHRQLVELLRRGDAAAAEELIERHIRHTLEALLEHLEGGKVTAGASGGNRG